MSSTSLLVLFCKIVSTKRSVIASCLTLAACCLRWIAHCKSCVCVCNDKRDRLATLQCSLRKCTMDYTRFSIYAADAGMLRYTSIVYWSSYNHRRVSNDASSTVTAARPSLDYVFAIGSTVPLRLSCVFVVLAVSVFVWLVLLRSRWYRLTTSCATIGITFIIDC